MKETLNPKPGFRVCGLGFRVERGDRGFVGSWKLDCRHRVAKFRQQPSDPDSRVWRLWALER